MGNLCSVSIDTGDVGRCWDWAAGPANYATNLPENLSTLKLKVEELKELSNDVARRVNVDERQNFRRLDQVQGWLSRAEAEIVETKKLIDGALPVVQKLCFGVSCSRNPLSGYRLGKEVVKKLQQVHYLKSIGDFPVVVGRAPSAVVEERPSGPTVGLEETFAQVCSSFSDGSVWTIGIHGMGGIGKTTLLIRLNNKLRQFAPEFNVVIWVTVSRGGEVEMIQEEVAKRVDLYDESWKSKRVHEKAVDIHRALLQRRFVLLLDDVWERVDLSRIGVPIPSARNGSKMVFTSRSEEVCGLMEPQAIIRVECLGWHHAWELFVQKAGPTLQYDKHKGKYARNMVRECRGLPLALVTIGRAMAFKKSVQEWRHASEVLSKCASHFSGMRDIVLPILKFSYDVLPSERVKTCFLYCALFPGRINKSSLIDYWIGEGFLDGRNDISMLQDEGYYVIGCLINASLLEDEGESVVVHDVIRDMAIWIACEYGQNHNVVVRAGARSTKAPEISMWEGAKWISLSANRIDSLEEAPQSSNLQTLILSHNCLKVITNDFFQLLPALTVLDLSYNNNLVDLPAGISALALLQHLNLSMTGIRQLPIELKQLTKMKCLNLDDTSALVNIPKDLISSFSQLQVLRMVKCGSETEVAGDSILSCEGSMLLVEDLQCLKSLCLLTITIRSVPAFQLLLSFNKFHSCTQELSIQNLGDSKSLDIAPLGHMEHLEVVHVRNCSELEVLEMEWPSEQPYLHPPYSETMTTVYLRSLHKVFVHNCPELRDLTWVFFAQNLRVLWVSLCRKMEQIIVAGKLDLATKKLGSILLPRLEVLYLSHLVQLKSLCGWSGVSLFPSNSRVLVRGCPKLITPPSHSSRQGVRSAAEQYGRYDPDQQFRSAPWRF